MSERLREQTMEWAVSTAGDGATAHAITEAAERFYQYVLRSGSVARADAEQRRIDRLLWEQTAQWRNIVARVGMASAEQRAAVWEILKDVEPFMTDAELERQARGDAP